MRVGAERRSVGEADRPWFPAVAKQPLKTAMQKAKAEFDRLAHRHRSVHVQDEIYDHKVILLLDPDDKRLAVQEYVSGKRIKRLADRWLFANEQCKCTQVCYCATVRQPQAKIRLARLRSRLLEKSHDRCERYFELWIVQAGGGQPAGGKHTIGIETKGPR